MAIELKTYLLTCVSIGCTNTSIIRDVLVRKELTIGNAISNKYLPQGWMSSSRQDQLSLNIPDYQSTFKYYDIDPQECFNVNYVYCEQCANKYKIRQVFE